MPEFLLPLATIAVGLLAAFVAERSMDRYARHLRRQSRLHDQAVDALEKHLAALRAVMARNDVDRSLKRMLLDHSITGLDERYTRSILDELLRMEPVDVPDDDVTLSLRELETVHPQAYAAVGDVIFTLIRAMVLSSPATIRKATDALEVVSERPDRVVRAAARPMRIPHMVGA